MTHTFIQQLFIFLLFMDNFQIAFQKQKLRVLPESQLTLASRTGVTVAKIKNNSGFGAVYLDYLQGRTVNSGNTLYFSTFSSTGSLQLSDQSLRASDGSLVNDPYIESISGTQFVTCFRVSSEVTSSMNLIIWSITGAITKAAFQVDSGSGEAGECALALLLTTDFVVFWNSANKIHLRMYDKNGNPLSSEITETFHQTIGKGCSCDSLGAGEFFCAYVRIDTTIGSSSDIFGQKFNKNGAKVGNEIAINEVISYKEQSPKVKALSNSLFVVCYYIEGIDIIMKKIMCRTFGNGTNTEPIPKGNSYMITDSDPNDLSQSSSSIEIISNSSFVITTEEKNGKIKGYTVSTTYETVSSAVFVNTYTQECSGPNVITIGGNFYYFWSANATTSYKDIYYLKFQDNPSCIDYPLITWPSQSVNLRFTNYMFDPYSTPVMVVFPSFPSQGTIKIISTGSAIVLSTPYELTALEYFAGTAGEVISFQGTNSHGSSSICSLTITLCYQTCATCTILGDRTNNQCLMCILGQTHKLYGQANQCLSAAPTYYYLNTNEDMYKSCYTTCETCSNDGTSQDDQNCLTCKPPYIPQPYDSTKCVMQCDLTNGEKWYIDASNRYTCVNQCPVSLSYYVDSTKECVAVCPSGTYQYLSQCYDYCPHYTVIDTIYNKCINCKLEINIQYYFNEACVSVKPTNGFLVSDVFNAYLECFQTCATCQELGNEVANKCIVCKQDYYRLSDNPNQCTNTRPQYYYFSTNEYRPCYSTCNICKNDGTSVNQNCLSCRNVSNYLYLGNCLDTCPDYTVPTSDVSGQTCLNCKTENKFYLNNECVDILPADAVLVSDLFNAYISCKISETYFFDGNCLISCPDYTVPTITFDSQTCLNCKTDNKFYLNNECVGILPADAVLVSDSFNAYISCKNSATYFFDGKCLANCPDYTVQTINIDSQICLDCKTVNKYYFNHECISVVPNNSILVSESFNAYIACDAGTYYFDGKCLAICPIYTVPLSSTNLQTCLNCKTADKYYFNQQCMDRVPSDAILISDSYNAYISCKDAGMYLIDGKCLNSCPNGYSSDLTTYTCYNCANMGKYYYLGVCYEKCPDNLKINELKKECINCKDSGFYYYNNECYLSCPNGYLSDSSNICISCPASAPYTYKYQCISSCPSNLMQDSVTRTCVYCKEINKYLLNNTCIDTCPEEYGSDVSNICLPCKTETTTSYSYNGRCVESCPSGYTKEGEKYSCISCSSLGIFNSTSCTEIAQNIEIIKELGNLTELSQTDKNTVKNIVENLISQNVTSSQTILAGNVAIQIANTSSGSLEESIQQALENHLSIVNFTECEKVLREYYNISSDKPLYTAKIDYKNSENNNTNITDVASSSFVYEIFDSDLQKLNTSICSASGAKISISIPLSNNSLINLTAYSNLSEVGIDIYNSSSTFFTDRCQNYSTSSGDITINDRISQMYSGYNVICNANCTYEGLNATTRYANCKCGDISVEMKLTFMENILDLFSTFNIDVVKCYKKTFSMPQLATNAGFYCLIGLAGAAVLFASISLMTEGKLLTVKGIKNVYNNEGGTLKEYLKKTFDNTAQNSSINGQFPACPPRNEKNNQIDEYEKCIKECTSKKETKKQNDLISPKKKVPNVVMNFDSDQEDEKSFENVSIERSRDGKTERIYPNSCKYIIIYLILIAKKLNEEFVKSTVSTQMAPFYLSSAKRLRIISSKDLNNPKFTTEVKCLNNCFIAKDDQSSKNNSLASAETSKRVTIYKESIEIIYRNRIRHQKRKENPQFTKSDLNNMKYIEAVLFDNRNYFQCVWDHIMTINYIFSTFLYDSLLMPKYLRVVFFFFSIVLNFFSNALFYLDSYISDKTKHPSLNQEFGYTFVNEFLKCTIAAFFGSIVKIVFIKIATPKEEYEEEFNKALKTQKYQIVRKA